MSVNTATAADAQPPQATSESASLAGLLDEILPLIFVVPVAGPPAVLLLGPWLVLVLLLAPPTALLITLVLVVLVAAGVVVALIGLPYLVVRRLHALYSDRRQHFVVTRRQAGGVATITERVQRTGRSGWKPANSAP
jgi:hypothetical protein